MTDTSELATRYEKGETISFPFQFPDDSILSTVFSFMSKIFTRSDRVFLFETVSSFLMELIQNAVKANGKRVFFESRGLDIQNPDDYARGIAEFKNAAMNLSTMCDAIHASSYRVTVSFSQDPDGATIIRVTNNSAITPPELERLTTRIDNAWKSATFSDIHEKAYDSSEGAGLGLVLTVFLLKNIGISRGDFTVKTDGSSVTATVRLPRIVRTDEVSNSIKTRIIEEVDNLPTFPENIMEFYAMCDDPETSIASMVEKIEKDPSISADVLRLANSAGFVSGKRIKSIHDAIVVIGIQNFKLLLTVTASRRILDGRYRHYAEIWEHCNRVTYYTQRIMMRQKSRNAYNSAIAALLHDVGKIVLLSIEIPLLEQISSIVKNNRIRTSTIVEELSIGISHATVGALIAKRWQFPEDLVEAIACHHSPIRAREEYRETVMAVYLADILCNIERRRFSYHFIETDVLERFSLADEDAARALHEELKADYETHAANRQE